MTDINQNPNVLPRKKWPIILILSVLLVVILAILFGLPFVKQKVSDQKAKTTLTLRQLDIFQTQKTNSALLKKENPNYQKQPVK